MHRMMIMGMTMVVVLVMGCARPSEELVPSGTVYVYDNSEGGELLGWLMARWPLLDMSILIRQITL